MGRVMWAATPWGGRLAEGDVAAYHGHVFQVQFAALIEDVGLCLGGEADHRRSFFILLILIDKNFLFAR